MLTLPAIYLSTAAYFFATWFTVFQTDSDLSPREQYLSWLVLIVATLFWPITAPIARQQRTTTQTNAPIHY